MRSRVMARKLLSCERLPESVSAEKILEEVVCDRCFIFRAV